MGRAEFSSARGTEGARQPSRLTKKEKLEKVGPVTRRWQTPDAGCGSDGGRARIFPHARRLPKRSQCTGTRPYHGSLVADMKTCWSSLFLKTVMVFL